MKSCPSCSREYDNAENFCRIDGARLAGGAVKDGAPADDPSKTIFPAAETLTVSPKQIPAEREKKAKSPWIMLVVLLGLAGVMGGGILTYYAGGRGVGLLKDTLARPFAGEGRPERSAGTHARTDVAQVLPAEELGFNVRGPGVLDVNRRDSLLSQKIESQFGRLRGLYQQQIQRKPDLMGTVTLQISIDSSGRVTRVNESKSHINDGDFKKAVIQEAYAWRFPPAPAGSVEINYPLLFLPPGMDVATIVNWERAIGPRTLVRTESKTSRPVQP